MCEITCSKCRARHIRILKDVKTILHATGYVNPAFDEALDDGIESIAELQKQYEDHYARLDPSSSKTLAKLKAFVQELSKDF